MQREANQRSGLAIVAAVQLPGVSDIEFEASLAELRELAKTLGFDVTRTFIQKRSSFDAGAYLGVGKRQEIQHFVSFGTDASADFDIGDDATARPRGGDVANDHADAGARARRQEIEVILVDHEISPSQARNLEKDVGCEVMDRTMVILEIFHRHARSRAARAQVEIARLGYMAPRLREAAKLAGPQGRQRSGVGGRGAGESHTEIDRRKIRDRIAELKQEIVGMDAERKTQRARRLGHEGLPGVALVGYTNAGKSTLMRALTGSDVLVADKLFATLDTTVRALHPESMPRILVTDTVGFIKNLPHDLVASFKSTLEEALDASLLLHVIDASDPGFERQIKVTDKVLEEIGAQAVPRLRIFNKIDHPNCGGDALTQGEFAAALRRQHPGCIVMSARSTDDVASLRQAIIAFFRQDLVEAEVFLPWSQQQRRGEIFARCEVVEERADGEGAFFRVRGESEAVKALCQQFGQAPD